MRAAQGKALLELMQDVIQLQAETGREIQGQISTVVEKHEQQHAVLVALLGKHTKELDDKLDTLTWRLAHVSAHIFGGAAEEWAKPLTRGPKRLTSQERQ